MDIFKPPLGLIYPDNRVPGFVSPMRIADDFNSAKASASAAAGPGDIAIEAADVTVRSNRLTAVLWARAISPRSYQRVGQRSASRREAAEKIGLGVPQGAVLIHRRHLFQRATIEGTSSMTKSRQVMIFGVLAIVAVAAVIIGILRQSGSSDHVSVTELAQRTHFHGIAVDPNDSARLLLATHHGLYAVLGDGSAERISETTDDFMGFMPHPADPAVLYASGHPASGGNLGFIESRDGGRSWSRLSPGAAGIADFHNMATSSADPSTLYGVYAGTLQVSRDGGANWAALGPAPEGLLDLAASAESPGQLFAGTKFGLLRSADGGKSWSPAYASDHPVPLVQVTRRGTVFAFVVGTGLIRSAEPDLTWQVVGSQLGDRFIVHLAADPADERRLYAVTIDRNTQEQEILASSDAGATWSPLAAGKTG